MFGKNWTFKSKPMIFCQTFFGGARPRDRETWQVDKLMEKLNRLVGLTKADGWDGWDNGKDNKKRTVDVV